MCGQTTATGGKDAARTRTGETRLHDRSAYNAPKEEKRRTAVVSGGEALGGVVGGGRVSHAGFLHHGRGRAVLQERPHRVIPDVDAQVLLGGQGRKARLQGRLGEEG